MNQACLQQFTNYTRFTHINDDELQAALIDCIDPYRYGAICVGRVQSITPRLAWIDIGAPKPALLKCCDQQLHQGMKCIVRVTRESVINQYENKGPQVVLDNNIAVDILAGDQQAIPRLVKAAQHAWLHYINRIAAKLTSILTIYIDDLNLFNETSRVLTLPLIKLVLKQSEPLFPIVDQYWQDLLNPVHYLEDGGHLLLEETHACHVFDLNTSGQDIEDASKRLINAHERLKFNQSAISQILKLIYLRALSGTIFIDFLRLNDWKLQQQLLIYLRQQAKSIKDLRILGFTPGGWIEACRTVKGPSLKTKADSIKY